MVIEINTAFVAIEQAAMSIRANAEAAVWSGLEDYHGREIDKALARIAEARGFALTKTDGQAVAA